MAKDVVEVLPLAIHMDFEKAAMNACTLLFKCKIYGCFFHQSQNFLKRFKSAI